MSGVDHDLSFSRLSGRSRRALVDAIERLDVSADAKALLNDILTLSVEVGGKLVAIGREIIDWIFETAKQFPNTAFGLVVGLVLSALISQVPVLGPLLGAVLGPLMIAFGVALGALADLQAGELVDRIHQVVGIAQRRTASV